LDALIFNEDRFNKLFEHQRAGIDWLWQLHLKQHGGILGDDMGMGKTVQIAAFLGAAYEARVIDRALIVLPASLLINWQTELRKWCPDAPVVLFHGSSKAKRERDLATVAAEDGVGGICLTTYGMVSSCSEQLAKVQWDYVVLDEGHTIKNPTNQVTLACRQLRAPHRILMTGTPVINCLKELWVLFDWACQSSLLGAEYESFRRAFETPIVNGNMQNALPSVKRIGAEISLKLREIIAPHFLRREKSLIQTSSDAAEQQQQQHQQQQPNATIQCRKNDFVVWITLSDRQKELYRAINERYLAANRDGGGRTPLPAIVLLKKVCDTPALLDNSMSLCDGLDLSKWANDALDNESARRSDDNNLTLDLTFDTAATDSSSSNNNNNTNEIFDHDQHLAWSSKFQFVRSLLQHLRSLNEQPQRTLVFSRSTRVLDIVQSLIELDGHRCVRVDGSVPVQERARRIDAFQSRKAPYDVMLLTSQVGGVGLTLTAANRVIILDPSWTNIDNQAVDRVYRIGQQRNVVVYRLITVGTVEEKIYRRQVFKQALLKTTTEKENQFRYFGAVELTQLFTIDEDFETGQSSTQKQLHTLHAADRVTDTELDRHIEWLHQQPIAGLSDHNLLFTTTESAVVVDDDVDQMARQTATNAAHHLHTPSQPKTRRRAPAGSAAKKTPQQQRTSHWLAPDTAARSDVDQVTDLLRTTLNFIDLTQDDDGAPPAQVCKQHELTAYQVRRCSCHVSREQSLRYTARLAEAERVAQLGDWRTDKRVARNVLAKLLDALELCDQDVELHRACIAMGRRLSLMR
jgi:SNF2 family DNA or RNA helicase